MSEKIQSNVPNGAADPERTQRIEPTPASFRFADDLSGSTIAGYKLVRKIAEGGMGVVYEAIQTKLDRKVALKVLTEQLGSRPEFLQRFEREAKAAAALNHPNMVQVFDYGQADGRHYIIMEYIEGENLSSYVDHQGKLSIDDALNVIEQAALALKSAAEKSIIHRDIKPSNLLLTMDGRVKVADLGLAKILTEDSELTLSNVGIGSPHFIAPEQADDSRKSDHRADIYSLGVTLLYLLTGKHAYDGASPISIVLAHTNKPLPSGAELGTQLPKQLETLIHRMAAKNPNDRYQDYQSLILDVQRVRTGLAPTAVIGKHSARKNQTVLGALAIGSVIVVSAVAIFWSKSNRASSATQTLKPEPVVSSSQENFPATRQPPMEGRFVPQNRPLQNRQGVLPPNGEIDGNQPGRLPMGPPPQREFYDIAPDSPEKMLAEADAYAASHSQNFEEILDGYRQVESRAGGTPIGREVASRLQDWNTRQQLALKEALATREAKMKELAKAGKRQEAFEVWSDFPPGLRTFEVDEEIRRMIEENLPAGRR